jgi:recombination protein RecA
MSSAVVSTSAARGRPFAFDGDAAEGRPPQRAVPAIATAAFISGAFKDARLAGVTAASRLAVRPAPEMVSSGIAAMDALTGGLPRGCLTEICGPASSGRTTLLLAALAAATRRGECCVVVDAGDALDPQSAAAAGVELERLLWVRCGESSPQKCLEQLLRATDLLLESGGFGLIALDLGDLPPQTARHIPLTTWFRFRRAVEHTPTVLLAIERQSIAGSCSSLLIKLGMQGQRIKESTNSQFPALTHAQLLTELEITAELVRSTLERKPVRSAEITFASKTAWAG